MKTFEIIFEQMIFSLTSKGFRISSMESSRPWGGFLTIDETQARQFAQTFFKDVEDFETVSGKLSPKILVVAHNKRLSWQYHHRRSEIWKVLEGPVGIVRSETDLEAPPEIVEQGTVIKFSKGERDRLIGLNCAGVVAEIWQHTDQLRPSDEMDIVRLQDDYGRN